MIAYEKAILKLIQNCKKDGATTQEAKQQLIEHAKLKPIKPRWFRYLFDDTTPEALLANLYENWPSAGLISSEASTILNGSAGRNFAPLNCIWDGADIVVDRKGNGTISLPGRRLTISMMIQLLARTEN